MKKEKQVRSYKRRTKSGKTVTVKAHTAKYEAADEKAKEVSKKEGAGKELEERKKKPVQLEIPFGKEEEKKVLDEVKGVEVSSMTGASLTRDAKLPKGITVKGSWRKISDAGTKGIGHSSWSSKADVFEATLSDGRKVTLHRTYGPVGETKVSYSSGESTKKPDEKKTTKKVRPVGSGTNGPSPKKKSETKSATDGISKSSGTEIAKAIGENRAHLLFEKALDKGRASVRKGGMKYTISIEERKDGTYAVFTKQGGSSMIGTTKATKSASAKTTAKPATSEPAFTDAEFKEWYRGTGSAADKKVAKALRAQLGRSGYRKLEDEAIDNYSSRGHLSMFKRVSGGSVKDETIKLSKGSFRTVDKNGKEIPGEPKHGTSVSKAVRRITKRV